jgi:DNA modification methylase
LPARPGRLRALTDLIVDPFAGGGTTLLAAKAAGGNAIGCDIDAESVRKFCRI